MTQAQLPAHLQNLQTPDIGGVLSANLGSAMPPHVSIGGGRFTLIDASNNEIPVPTFDPVIGVYLDAAIIDVNPVMSRVYFEGQYDPNADGVRPTCFSDNGVGPSISSSTPQAPTCAACPRSEWTKVNPNGKKVPWCTHKQKVALLIPGFDVLFLLAVPPNSHGPMREYVERCKGNGVNMANLITRISFMPGVQGTLQFAPVAYIDAPTAELRQKAYVEKKTDALVGRNDVARGVGSIGVGQQVQPLITNAGPQTQVLPATPTQMPPTGQQFLQSNPIVTGPALQVQQPDPFVPVISNAPAAATNWPQTTAASSAASVQTAEQLTTGRRRRRTAAEMQAANGAQPAGQLAAGPTAAAQAPFPHPGQAATTQPVGAAQFGQQPATAPVQTDTGFGISSGQPASGKPELTAMLDDFFTKG